MTNDFIATMNAHQAEFELVTNEFTSRAAIIARLKACKTPEDQAAAEIWLWGAWAALWAIKNGFANKKNAIAVIAAQKQTVKAARAEWFPKADGAARAYSHSIRKEAGLIATNTQGGARKGAGRKPDAIAAGMSAETPKVETPKAPKVEAPKADIKFGEIKLNEYKAASPRDGAVFARAAVVTVLSMMKQAGNSQKTIAAGTAFLEALANEIKACE